ncbi:cycloartenol synthase 2-like [Iris pallida]|uniref:Cycloartenol synthase 2-like n=1 Tax=Iris pallida TaxID=29817 RepID=A0AAX6GEQ6_IRIPA|nr:cycloartenol synthase 2-like [Iris pallida]
MEMTLVDAGGDGCGGGGGLTVVEVNVFACDDEISPLLAEVLTKKPPRMAISFVYNPHRRSLKHSSSCGFIIYMMPSSPFDWEYSVHTFFRDSPEEVKASLKYWAQAVACYVRLCSLLRIFLLQYACMCEMMATLRMYHSNNQDLINFCTEKMDSGPWQCNFYNIMGEILAFGTWIF